MAEKKSVADIFALLGKARTRVRKEKEARRKDLERKVSGEPKPSGKPSISEFEDVNDWMLSMILIGVMHSNPGIEAREAIRIGREWTKKLYMPRSEHLWRRQVDRIQRTGIRAFASRIRRELFKLI